MKKPIRRRSGTGEPEEQPHILVIDDEAPIRELLESYLSGHGFKVTTMSSGEKALRSVNKLPVQLILLDILLEDADGLDLLKKFKTARPTRPVIIISGIASDEELVRLALERGGEDCGRKTTPLPQLWEKIKETLQQKKTPPPDAEKETLREAKRRQWQEMLALARAAAETPDSAAPSLAAPAEPAPTVLSPKPILVADQISVTPEGERFDFGMEVFARMLSAYHPNLGSVAVRTVAVCRALGEALGLPTSQRQSLLWAAALHDIGLVGIDRSVVGRWLRSSDKCTDEELILIRRHPEQSQQLLEFCPAFNEARDIIAAHHENWDGSGYPAGWRMEMIPWLSRLLAVAVYYCAQRDPDAQTIKEIKARANQIFDPQAVDAFLEIQPDLALPRGPWEIMAYEVKAGMVLAKDIVNWDGLLVVGQGSTLTHATASKIANLARAGQTEPFVLIYC